MGFLRLLPNNIAAGVRKLNAAKFFITQYEEKDLDILDTGVMIKSYIFDEESRVITATPILNLAKNMVLVNVNPALAEVCGVQPGYQTILTAGFYGQLEFTLPETTSAEALGLIRERLNTDEWICQLHYITAS